MSILSREDILDYQQNRGLVIDPFDPDKCEPASYDLLLGKVLKAGFGTLNLRPGEDVTLLGGEWASIMSQEKLKLPTDLCGTYGLRSAVTRRGLIHFGGPQIDPGYEGRLFVSIYNPTLEPIVLRFGDPLFTIIFHKLLTPPETGYEGRFQGQFDFPADDVERMMKMRSKSFSDVFDRVDELDQSVQVLSENLKELRDDVHSIKGILESGKGVLSKLFWVILVAVVGIGVKFIFFE